MEKGSAFGRSLFCVLPAAAAAALSGDIGREELVDGELDVAEDLAGIVLAAAAGALLLRQAVVIDWDQKLGIPLQADDGELAQCYEHSVYIAVYDQILLEDSGNSGWDIQITIVAAVAVTGVHQLQV